MKSKLIVSAVQLKVLSVKRNLFKILKYIQKASGINSDIICFPECSFNPNYKKASLEKDLAPIQKACKKANIFVIINGYFRGKNKNIYNRTYLIDNKGKILGFYDKIHLWVNELNNVRRGRLVKVINTHLGRIGLCTCWDLFFPNMFAELRNKGAEIIFCLAYWKDEFNKKDAKFLEYAPTVIAYQHMCFCVFCNASSRGATAISQIAAPWDGLKKMRYEEGMITAKLYYQRLKRFKDHFKIVFFERNLN